MGVQRVFTTHSKAFMCTHKHSGGVQYLLTGIQAHSQAFRACLVLTQMRSFSWSHHSKSRSIMTQWQSCALIGCSHSPNGSQHTQWVFRGCSHSLIGVHAHSMGVQGVFNAHSLSLTCIHKLSGGCSISLKGVQLILTLEGPI
jgi:hypothetical protein